jgi:phenylpyruvate tautomerase PptA (4-oxalocrotonate tautomerase family)
MTVITVNTPKGRLTLEQRRLLAQTLTNAVLIPEVGQHAPEARIGFQVHFVEREPDMIAIGGALLSDSPEPADAMVVDVAVMYGAWPREIRAQAIEGVLAALADACGMPAPSPSWWVTFRVIDEGSWASAGRVLSMLLFLDADPEHKIFPKERADAIRAAIATAP